MASALQVSQLLALGLKAADLCDHLCLDAVTLGSETLSLSTRAHQGLLQWAAIELNMPDLGIHLGHVTTETEFGLRGYIAKSAPTLRSSLEMIAKYHELYAADSVISLHTEGKNLLLEYLPNRVSGIEPVQDIYFSLALTVEHVRRNIDPRFMPAISRFAFARRSADPNLSATFGKNIAFNQPISAIAVPIALADLPMPHADPTLPLGGLSHEVH